MSDGKNLNPIEFSNSDIEFSEVPVTIASEKYVLVEASGGVAVEYRNATMKGFILGPEGKPQKVEGLADIEPLLVSRCLRKIDGTKRVAVPIQTVKAWPNKILKALFERAKEISELNEDTDTEESINSQIEDLQERLETLKKDEVGNEQSDTEDGS